MSPTLDHGLIEGNVYHDAQTHQRHAYRAVMGRVRDRNTGSDRTRGFPLSFSSVYLFLYEVEPQRMLITRKHLRSCIRQ